MGAAVQVLVEAQQPLLLLFTGVRGLDLRAGDGEVGSQRNDFHCLLWTTRNTRSLPGRLCHCLPITQKTPRDRVGTTQTACSQVHGIFGDPPLERPI